jgi:hypothetical protein
MMKCAITIFLCLEQFTFSVDTNPKRRRGILGYLPRLRFGLMRVGHAFWKIALAYLAYASPVVLGIIVMGGASTVVLGWILGKQEGNTHANRDVPHTPDRS